MTKLRIVPVELKHANEVVAAWHRHHKPVQGHRFSIGVVDDAGTLHGIATVGRPVARNAGSPTEILEVSRVATDGTPNACSALYGAAARVGRELGYRSIQTYTLADEPGTSLRAAGWVDEGIQRTARTSGNQWVHSDGVARRDDQPVTAKRRWRKVLNP